ncbi:MAG: IS1595 family transposase [Chthoniobacterales bacterium]
MNKDDLPKTMQEAFAFFSDEQRCHDFMVWKRWPDGKPVCPRCDSQNIGKCSPAPRRVWNCKGCKKQFTVKVATIFEDSPLPLTKWLPAFWMIVNAKNAISSCELARSLGVSQKTAWFMGHRIRLAIREGMSNMMKGRVEADESFIGALSRYVHKDKRSEKITGTGGSGKTAVMGLLERGTREKSSRVTLRVLKTTKRAELQGYVRQCVERDSEVLTDNNAAYWGLQGEYVHNVIDHAVSYANGHIHTNGLENFWALLKRSIKGTHVHVAPFHLFRYLDDQAYRFNQRRSDDSDRFIDSLSTIANRRLTFKKLTAKDEREKK